MAWILVVSECICRQPQAKMRHPGLHQQQPGTCGDEIFRKISEAALDRLEILGVEQRAELAFHQLGCADPIPHGDQVIQRFVHLPVADQPGGCAPVEELNLIGMEVKTLAREQHLAKQVVIAVPGALGVQWDQEELGGFDAFQQCLDLTFALLGTEHFAQQGCAELVEGGRLEQELLDLIRLVVEHLVEQVIAHLPVRPVQVRDQLLRLDLFAQADRCQG